LKRIPRPRRIRRQSALDRWTAGWNKRGSEKRNQARGGGWAAGKNGKISRKKKTTGKR